MVIVDHTPPAPTRGRPRDPERDTRILEAARTLIGEVGYDRMTVDAIAERAGVSKPTIYRRWNGKPEIVAAAISRRKDERPFPDTGSLRGDLLAVVHRLGASLSDEDAQLAAGVTGLLRSSPEFAAIFREHVVMAERARWNTLVERSVARGELEPGAAVTPLFADVAGSVVFTRVMLAREPIDDAFVEELVDRVLLPILPLSSLEKP
jgi:AcrR family transcriptional regulator